MAFVGCSDPASLVFHLNELGLDGVARHLKDIAGLGDTRRVVPTFAAPKMSSASPELVPILKALHLMSVKKQREEFRETMITNEDSEIVRRIMADKDTLPVELVRFRTLEKELGKEKFNLCNYTDSSNVGSEGKKTAQALFDINSVEENSAQLKANIGTAVNQAKGVVQEIKGQYQQVEEIVDNKEAIMDQYNNIDPSTIGVF